jgi:hypothetical protein
MSATPCPVIHSTEISKMKSMPLFRVSLLLLSFVASVAILPAQTTLYVPGGNVGSISGSNVGIGTNTPGVALDVIGTVRSSAGFATWGTGQLTMQWVNTGDATDQKFTELIQQNGQFVGRFVNDAYNAADNWLIVKRNAGSYSVNSVNFPSGNVGVGTLTPAYKLHVVDSSGQVSIGMGEPMSSATAASGYRVASWNDGNVYVDAKVTTGGAIIHRYGEGAQSGSANTWMVLKGGNVGIGTTTPSSFGDGSKLLTIAGTTSYGGLLATTNSVHGQLWANEIGSAVHLGSRSNHSLLLTVDNTERMRIDTNGNVGVGTASPSHKLAVNGTIRAKEVIVDTGWSDYVFADDYRLAPLSEVETHIKAARHLPGIPSAKEVAEHGVSMGDMQAKLLAKIEELTLHVIAQQKQLEAQQSQIRALNTFLSQ